jgi:predicted ATPase/DNA-binding CsgD family transcriptional regulator
VYAMSAAAKTGLAEELTSFVGREAEVAELRALMREARAVTLCGAGGIGKTRLALHLIADAADDFPDGVSVIDLAEVNQPDLVIATAARAVGADPEPGRPLAETLVDAVRSRRMLLVLDNCEHLIAACASLCQQLLASSPGLSVLATSREPLRVAAEAVWSVPPLTLPPAEATDAAEIGSADAIRLFADRAAAVSSGFSLGAGNASTVARICRALEGLPLAIELAAAWVRVLTVDQIAARISDRFALLTSAERGAPERQRTLRGTIDWSYDLLTAPERLLMRRLSVFASWSLEMAEQVCADEQLPAAAVLDLITALGDKSLLEIESELLGQARYRMLDTIREYADAQLAASGESDDVYARWHAYALGEAERMSAMGLGRVAAPWSTSVLAFRRVDVEAGNLREVLQTCLDHGDYETGLRLCTALGSPWIVRGAFAEGASWLDSYLDVARHAPPEIRGPAVVTRAQIALAAGESVAAELAMAGLELCWDAGSQFWTAAALNALTEIDLHAGLAPQAEARAAEALSVARSSGDRFNEGYALGTGATAAAFQGRLAEAEQLAQEALAVMREIDQQWGCARTLLGLGDLARLRGDLQTARDRYAEALPSLRELNARPQISRCLAGLGLTSVAEQDLAAAHGYFTESLQISGVSGSRVGILRGLDAMIMLAMMEGEQELAVRLAAAVTALRSSADLPQPTASVAPQVAAATELGSTTMTEQWAEGSELTSGEAVQLALRTGQHATARSQQPAASRPPAAGLTAREREVVVLIAAGYSNRAIARKLFISPATAARHVANIMAKLGVSSRSQVAAWAVSAGADQPGGGV